MEAILAYSLNYTYIDGLLAWNTDRIEHVIVDHHPRANGRSGYSLRKLIGLAVNLFTNFSLLPLQLVSLGGLLAGLVGFAIGGFFLAQYFLNNIAVPGYASIIVAIFVLGGLQLLGLGVLGEYLGRLHLNVNRKPQFTVRTLLPAACRRGAQDESEACSDAVSASPTMHAGCEAHSR
jgi:undecaprenyl-phosphate 4-deoxy-4-formamido-L-arabinose transferase